MRTHRTAHRIRPDGRRGRVSAALLGGVLTIGIATACAGGGTPELRVDDPQAAVPTAGSSQVVITITNDGDGTDRLVGLSTPAAIGAEMHLTEIVDQRATMRELEEVELPAGEQVSFRPGGLHLMLVVPDESVRLGATFELILHFARSEDLTVEVEVVDLLDLSERDADDADAGGSG